MSLLLLVGNGPNTVSESTASNTELSDFLALTEFRGENSVSSSQPIICVPNSLTDSFANLTEFAAELSSETVLPKQYSARFLFGECSQFHQILVNFSQVLSTFLSFSQCWAV